MLGNLIKRKIDAEKLANVFVNSVFNITDQGFPDLKEMIEQDNAFVHLPQISEQHCGKFLLIVAVGNLKFLYDHFEREEADEIKKKIIAKFASAYEMSFRDFETLLEKTESFISSVNHPSKNMLYGMSKAVFHKFELNHYQEDYFKSMKTPNPLFLKRMDEVMSHFLWDWDHFFKKHKFILN